MGLLEGTANAFFSNACGKGGQGVSVTGSSNRVIGNDVGPIPTGAVGSGKNWSGITLAGSNNVVGGKSPGSGNWISGNTNGISLSGSDNRVQGNLIGTNAAGTAHGPLNDTGIAAGGSGNVIGGAGPNVVAFNTDGIDDFGKQANAIAIRRNSIYSNTNLGIDLGPKGVTPNDPRDTDSGPNSLQNFPRITSAPKQANGIVTLKSTIDAPFAGESVLVDFYSSDACDASGFGEGRNYLGSAIEVSGAAILTKTFPAVVPSDRFFTATATNTAGMTSEFSQCLSRSAAADLSATAAPRPDSVRVGDLLQFQGTVTNNGPDAATNVRMDIEIHGATYVSDNLGTCDLDSGTNVLTCGVASLAPGATLSVLINTTAVGPTSAAAQVTASDAAPADPNAANNQAIANAEVSSG